ncbi:quinate 5-dehydrogenase [Alkaliphilus hydrothermalis]|uniref:Quinate 5-dehydrogenase n=1 Tax=Alkaliphilus hydrothermalis TaxID=1482730 RepID=A0ABS2NSQ1_9FIRM|nr:quinate 5-dehydrogenase [Alkaliphilus hydrothermalis]MBM7615994.1 hypothetical protein [Alkaliphilus hydrothermalis]
MKRIVSISIGSSKRDHQAVVEITGQEYQIERIGTDGSLTEAVNKIKSLDGKVEAFGMGGIDLYIWAGKRPYVIREALKLKNAAIKSPIVDGSGLKNTLERRVISYLQDNKIIDFNNKQVLITSAMDRFGMAETLDKLGANLTIGDLIFGLGINKPIYSLKQLAVIARAAAPIVCKLPFKWLYPTGSQQNDIIKGRFDEYYQKATIIAGDFHYIKRYMPLDLKDKIIITNTLTNGDLVDLKSRGVKILVSTTPELHGRSFGTNVMEALLVSILKERRVKVSPENYDGLIDELKFMPRVEFLQENPRVNKSS